MQKGTKKHIATTYHFSKDEFIKSAWFQENLLNHVYIKKMN